MTRGRSASIAGLMLMSMALVDSSLADELQNAELAVLMFPQGTYWNDLPLVKWDRKPRGLIILDGTVSHAEEVAIEAARASFQAKAPVSEVRIIAFAEPSATVIKAAIDADFTLVFGESAIQDSLGRFKSVLAAALTGGVTSEDVVNEAISASRPAFSRFRFDTASGRMERGATFVNVNGDADRALSIATIAMFASLAPSVPESAMAYLIFDQSSASTQISDYGYQYLRRIYSSDFPIGTKEEDVLRPVE